MYYIKAFLSSFNIVWLYDHRDERKKAANYIILFVFILSVLYAGYFTAIIPQKFVDVRDDLFSQFPQDLNVQLEDGELTVTGIEQPFVYQDTVDGETVQLVIDTSNTSTVSLGDVTDGTEISTILITKHRAIIQDASLDKTTVQDFGDISNVSSTKQQIIEWSDGLLSHRVMFFVFLLIIWFLILTVSRVIYTLALALLVWIIARIAGKEEWTFGRVYTVGLFAVSAPSVVVALTGLAHMYIPYLYTVLLLALLLTVIFYKKPNTITKTKEQSE